MADEPVSEADALEQALLVEGPEEPELHEIPPDVPEADALEQARPLDEAPEPILDLPPDVPEADALDQKRPTNVEDDDDDWR
jgi:hypothetical protein